MYLNQPYFQNQDIVTTLAFDIKVTFDKVTDALFIKQL